MNNLDFLRDLKNRVVAIGLAETDVWKPLGFAGTGFFVSSDGYLVSASHVFESCDQYVKTNKNLKIVIFTFNHATNQSNIVPVGWAKITIPAPHEAYVGPGDLDLGLGKAEGENMPFLELSEEKSELYEEVIICGYPNPTTSLTMFEKRDEYSGMRHSPITQFGRISAFLPNDAYVNPYGIQTDVIGTGGSSGSPIVSVNSRKVVGLAQQVIPAEVDVKVPKVSGMAKVGLTFGITSRIIKKCYDAGRKSREKGDPMYPFDLELPGAVYTITRNLPPDAKNLSNLNSNGEQALD